MPKIAMLALALIPDPLRGALPVRQRRPVREPRRGPPRQSLLQDTGAEQDGKPVNFGRDVAQSLEQDGGFGWTETDEAPAQDGVRTGSTTQR